MITAREFVNDDYQENVWYNGDTPCCPVADLRESFETFKADCIACGREFPDDLTPELYFDLWNEEYERRTA